MPEFLAKKAIEAGELIELLPDWQKLNLEIFAMWSKSPFQENLTMKLVRFLTETHSK